MLAEGPVGRKASALLPARLRSVLAGLRRRARRLRLPPTSLEAVPRHPRRRLLAFEPVPDPEVSVVIPVRDRLDLTLDCLESIARARVAVEHEVLIADDGSTPTTLESLRAIPGLRVVAGGEAGFVGAANRGAAAARGRFLVFLNNDTVVTDGWLDRLRSSFGLPQAGAVGAKLIHPDGRLQEAGGIVWSDGSALNFGRGEHPDEPGVSFARPVDYCSAACLMVATEVFGELGGFDVAYSPAYYEDVELAFRLRQHGKRVWYQPLARIFHHEGGTAGTDLRRGVKRHQEANRVLFRERWAEVLAGQPRRGTDPLAARDREATGHSLVVDATVPTADRDAGSLRRVVTLEALRDLGERVTFAPLDLVAEGEALWRLQGSGIEVLRRPWCRGLRAHLASEGWRYQRVLLARPAVAARLLPMVRRHCRTARVVFDTVDLRFLRQEREDLVLRGRAGTAGRRAELRLVSDVDATLVTSPEEKRLLAELAPGAVVEVVSTFYPLSDAGSPYEERRDLLFVGGFLHRPNVDAVLWLARQVLPSIRLRLPGVRLEVVGPDPPAEIRSLAGEEVRVHGHQPSLDGWLGGCRVAVAPLRFGAGLKGKVHQSLASGLPCVATPVAAEGLGATSGVHLLIADAAEEFADAVVRLYEDPDLWGRLQAEGRALVERSLPRQALVEGLRRALYGVTPGDVAGPIGAVGGRQRK